LTRYRGKVVGFCNTGCRDKFEAALRAFDTNIGGEV
jgi:YHS domain-containing protein